MSQHNLWILLIVFGATAASWVFGQLRDQARKKQARDEAQRRYEEHLRTGLPMEQPAPASVRQQELAERRAAQLRELRRQQETQRESGAAVVVARPTPAARPSPGRAVGFPPGVVMERVPMPGGRQGAPGQRQGRPATRPAPAPLVDPMLEAQRRRAAEQAERLRLLREAELAAQAEEEAARRRRRAASASHAPPTPETPRAVPMVNFVGVPRASLRQAIAAMEVLGPPVSLRRDFLQSGAA